MSQLNSFVFQQLIPNLKKRKQNKPPSKCQHSFFELSPAIGDLTAPFMGSLASTTLSSTR
jgi:hypothetical protein